MQFDLKDRIAVVTGAAGNIGAAICRKLREQGAVVIAADITARSDDAICDAWRILDVTKETSWAELVDWVRVNYGRLDILVNNAGVAPMGTLEGTSLSAWRRCQGINVDGVFMGMKAAMPLLKESGETLPAGASIVNIASAASNRATPFSAAYATSKAAVAMLTKAVGIENMTLRYRVRANSIHPAAVRSDMIETILADYSKITGGTPVEDLRKAMVAEHPMGRLVEPDEVADAVLFLVSDASQYINASELNVDGGLTAN